MRECPRFARLWNGSNNKSRTEGTGMPNLENLRVKIFADGADKATMIELAGKPYVRGLTTNPTLMRQAGVTDYEAFAREVLEAIPDLPISFEVFADQFDEM